MNLQQVGGVSESNKKCGTEHCSKVRTLIFSIAGPMAEG